MSYFVGPKRDIAETIPEAIELAVGLIPERNLGHHVNIYKGHGDRAQVFARVKVLYDREEQKFRYVYFASTAKYGYTITKDFNLDRHATWFNTMRTPTRGE